MFLTIGNLNTYKTRIQLLVTEGNGFGLFLTLILTSEGIPQNCAIVTYRACVKLEGTSVDSNISFSWSGTLERRCRKGKESKNCGGGLGEHHFAVVEFDNLFGFG